LEAAGVEADLGGPLAVAIAVARADSEQLFEDLAGFREVAEDGADRGSGDWARVSGSEEPVEASRAREVDPALG
jgi:hypothetical protein